MAKKEKNKGGRPLFDGKDTKDVISKLEQAALIDATVEEMCFYADISVAAYYRYIEVNPKFREKITALRERLTLKSRQNIATRIESGDISLSKWHMERKKPDEYGERINLNHSGEIDSIPSEDKAAIASFHASLKENLRKRSLERAKEEGDV